VTRALIPCGTVGAYGPLRRHQDRHEPLCDMCTTTQESINRANRIRRRAAEGGPPILHRADRTLVMRGRSEYRADLGVEWTVEHDNGTWVAYPTGGGGDRVETRTRTEMVAVLTQIRDGAR
jgi:hypothetical protein